MSCHRVGTWGGWGAKGVKKSNIVHVAYQIDGDNDLNRMQVNILPYDPIGDLVVRSKGQISQDFHYRVNFKDFLYQLQIKDIKHIERNFHSVTWVMPRWWDLGVNLGRVRLP